MSNPPLVLLYQQTPKDLAGARWGPWSLNFFASAALTAFSITNTGYPPEVLVFVSSITVTAMAGVAQTTLSLSAFLRDSAGNNIGLVGFKPSTSAAGIQDGATFEPGGLILIPPRTTIGASGVFSAGVAANFLGISLQGTIAPQGNVALF